MFKVIILLAVIAAAAAERIQTRPCPGGFQQPNWFESNDCSASRCRLTRGQVFSGRAEVTTMDAPHAVLTVGIQATLLGLPFDMPIPEAYSNACDFLEGGVTCPVQTGQTFVWALQFPIIETLPLVNNLIIRLWAGEGGRRLACAEVDADIVAA